MSYINEFPHGRMWDSDLRQILEMYNTVKGLPNNWETFKSEFLADWSRYTSNLNNEWSELKNFVNTYFTNLDVQTEINNKIDVMIADGTIDSMLKRAFDLYTVEINVGLHNVQTDVNTLKARMDTFTKLPNESTSGDAELTDGRVDYTGKTWGNIGSHIRGVSANLSNEIGECEVTQLYNPAEWESSGYYDKNADGFFINTYKPAGQTFGRATIPVIPGHTYYINHKSNNLVTCYLDSEKQPLQIFHLIGNSFTVPNNEEIAFISYPVTYHSCFDILVTDSYNIVGASFIQYGETERLRELAPVNGSFSEKVKNSVIYSKHCQPFIVNRTIDNRHAVLKCPTITDDKQFDVVSFNTTKATITLANGFLLLGYDFKRNYAIVYQHTTKRYLLLGLTTGILTNGFIELATVEENPENLYGKKLNIEVNTESFIIKDFFTDEIYVNNNVADMLRQYTTEISLGLGYAHNQAYSDMIVCTIYDNTDFTGIITTPAIETVYDESHWNGKLWYAYGTSLTSIAQGTYAKYLAEISNMSCVNKGIGGGGIIANRNIYNAVMANDGKNAADLITLEIGANDSVAPLGTPLDTDNTTFCGSLNQCIKHLLENCPKAQIVVMPSTRGRYPHGNSGDTSYEINQELGGGFTYDERDEAIRKCCMLNGVYFIPFNQLGLGLHRMKNNNNYVEDNIHHTDLGGYNLAQGIWGYLKNIPLWYSELPQ